MFNINRKKFKLSIFEFLNLKWNSIIILFLVTWLYEWLIIFKQLLRVFTYLRFIYPYRIPILLLICLLYYIYVWGISVWRRTQYGKFTRGDRKLWYKGFASFWIVELSTLLGLIIAAAWMNWGPTPLFPRNFYGSKKSFIIELVFISYILWSLYLLRFSIKWKKWKYQISLIFLILFFVILLIWRDILIIIGRENINIQNGVRWKFIRANTVIYSLLPDWWFYTLISNKNIISKDSIFLTLFNFIENNKFNDKYILPINFKLIIDEYYKYNLLPLTKNVFNTSYYTSESLVFYPRKIGFLTKRIAMWTFFLFLKIWHHLMLYIWWFFYLIRLISRKKNSYQFLSICHFNIYCCFLIALSIYIYGLFPKFMIFFRFFKKRPEMVCLFRPVVWKNFIANYFISIFNFNILKFKIKIYIRHINKDILL